MSGLIHQGSAVSRISLTRFVEALSFLCFLASSAEPVWKLEVRVTPGEAADELNREVVSLKADDSIMTEIEIASRL